MAAATHQVASRFWDTPTTPKTAGRAWKKNHLHEQYKQTLHFREERRRGDGRVFREPEVVCKEGCSASESQREATQGRRPGGTRLRYLFQDKIEEGKPRKIWFAHSRRKNTDCGIFGPG